jgi:hypothetical protein
MAVKPYHKIANLDHLDSEVNLLGNSNIEQPVTDRGGSTRFFHNLMWEVAFDCRKSFSSFCRWSLGGRIDLRSIVCSRFERIN